MIADEPGHPVELRTPEAAALVEADGIEPELGHVLVALHVDVRRLGGAESVRARGSCFLAAQPTQFSEKQCSGAADRMDRMGRITA